MFPSPVRRCHRPRKISKADSDQIDIPSNGSEKLEARLRNLERSLQNITALIENKHREPIAINGTYLPEDTPNACNESLGRLDAIEARFDGLSKSLSPANSTPRRSGPNFDDALELPERILVPKTFPPVFPFNFDINSSLLQPSPSKLPTIWRIFKDGADQLAKVVHRPSAEHLLQQALRNPTALDNGQMALVFAIYFASVVSMSPEQTRLCFNMSRSTAISLFRSATENALMRAGILFAESLTTLQALVLFIAFSRIDQSQPTWALTGLARRLNPPMATKVGTPFEMEMRRRIWWYLWFLDYRAVVNEGEDDTLAAVEPELPVNVDDDDLHAGMTRIPEPFNGWTAMTFGLIRFTIARTSLIVDRDVSWYNKKVLIDECAFMVQSTYLKHCDGQEPVHWLARHVAHVHITEMHLKLYCQQKQSLARASGSWMDRDRLIHAAIDILDVKARLRTEPESQNWKWLLNPFPHFMPLQFLLNELSQQQIRPPPAQVWIIAESSYLMAANETRVSKSTDVLRSLMAKARIGTRGMLEWQESSGVPRTGQRSRPSEKQPETDNEILSAEFVSNPEVLDIDDFNYEDLLSFENVTAIPEVPFTIMDGLDLGITNERIEG